MAEDDIDRMIETGEAENIFQKAMLEQVRLSLSRMLHTPDFTYLAGGL